MTDFTDNLALSAIIFIFVVHCIELTINSSLVQSSWNKATKFKVIIESQNVIRGWAKKMGIISPKKTPSSIEKFQFEDKNAASNKDVEAQSPNKVNALTSDGSPTLKQRRTPKMQRAKIKYVNTSQKQHSDAKKYKKGPKLNLESVNTYDLFKLFSTVTMFIDHYGYIGLPLRTQFYNIPSQHWLRIYGRAAAPGFFFLAGYSSKRFRMQVWIAAVFLYWFTVYFFLDIVFVPFESILCVALINCVYKYLPPHKILSHWLVSMVAVYLMHSQSRYMSKELHIGYGALPFMFAIAGDMVKHKKKLASWIWCVGTCASFATYSMETFARDAEQSKWIIGESVLNCLFMVFFSIKEISSLNHLPEPVRTLVRDGIKWISRNGLIVYIGHLMLFRLIRQTYRLPPAFRY